MFLSTCHLKHLQINYYLTKPSISDKLTPDITKKNGSCCNTRSHCRSFCVSNDETAVTLFCFEMSGVCERSRVKLYQTC